MNIPNMRLVNGFDSSIAVQQTENSQTFWLRLDV